MKLYISITEIELFNTIISRNINCRTDQKFSYIKWLEIRRRILANMTVVIIVFVLRGISKFFFNHFSLDWSLINDSVVSDDWIFPFWVIIWYTWEDFIPIVTQILLVRSIYNDLKMPEQKNYDFKSGSKASLETFLLTSEGTLILNTFQDYCFTYFAYIHFSLYKYLCKVWINFILDRQTWITTIQAYSSLRNEDSFDSAY